MEIEIRLPGPDDPFGPPRPRPEDLGPDDLGNRGVLRARLEDEAKQVTAEFTELETARQRAEEEIELERAGVDMTLERARLSVLPEEGVGKDGDAEAEDPLKAFTAFVRERIAGLPEGAREDAALHAGRERLRLDRARRGARHNASVARLQRGVDDSLDALTAQAARDPERLVELAERGFGLLDATGEGLRFDKDQQTALRGRLGTTLATTALRAMDPKRALAALQGSGLRSLLPDEETRAALTVELTAAEASQKRALKAETGALMRLHLERLDRGEPGVPEIARDVEIDIGAEDARAFNEQAAAARQRHFLRQQWQFAPETEIAGALKGFRRLGDLLPGPDVVIRPVTLKMLTDEPVRFVTLEKVADEILEARRRDPAAAVAEQPKLQALLAAAEEDPTQRGMAAEISLDLQKELGVPEGERRVFTRQGLSDLMGRIEAAPPAQRTALLQEVKDSSGAHFDAVLGELETARLDPTTLALARRLDDPLAARRLGGVLDKSRAALTEGFDPAEVAAVSEAARAAVPGALAPAAERLALDRYRQSGDADDAVAVARETLGHAGDDAVAGGEEDDQITELATDGQGIPGFTAGDRAAQRRRGGSTPGSRAAMLPEDELDRLERQYRDLVDRGRSLGWEFASGNLQHFLDGSGDPRTFTAETLRAFDAVTEAEAFNRNRFDGDWTREKAVVYQKVVELSDGESVVIELTPEMRAEQNGKADPNKQRGQPIWSRQIWLSRKPRNALGIGSREPNSEFELFFGSGNSELLSEGRFRATRVGDVVTVQGRVAHHWNDTYDWHKGLGVRIPFLGTVDDDDAVALEEIGRAKSFEMASTWFQDVTVTLQIVDGKPTKPRIEWGPIIENE